MTWLRETMIGTSVVLIGSDLETVRMLSAQATQKMGPSWILQQTYYLGFQDAWLQT